MTHFYDFLADLEGGGVNYRPQDVDRMNRRYDHIIEPMRDLLDGAEVLDLGSHDGRWACAFAAAGATVTGIEGRRSLIDQFDRYPDFDGRDRISFVEGDFIEEMDRMLAEGRRYDVVSCLGVFYHTMHHYKMLLQMTAFRPKVIAIDSVFHTAKRPIIAVRTEETASRRASISLREGQSVAPVGYASRPALRVMAESLGYAVEWVQWDVPEEQRHPVRDYFPRDDNHRRFTCFLRPA